MFAMVVSSWGEAVQIRNAAFRHWDLVGRFSAWELLLLGFRSRSGRRIGGDLVPARSHQGNELVGRGFNFLNLSAEVMLHDYGFFGGFFRGFHAKLLLAVRRCPRRSAKFL